MRRGGTEEGSLPNPTKMVGTDPPDARPAVGPAHTNPASLERGVAREAMACGYGS